MPVANQHNNKQGHWSMACKCCDTSVMKMSVSQLHFQAVLFDLLRLRWKHTYSSFLITFHLVTFHQLIFCVTHFNNCFMGPYLYDCYLKLHTLGLPNKIPSNYHWEFDGFNKHWSTYLEAEGKHWVIWCPSVITLVSV